MTITANSEFKISDKAFSAARYICSKIGSQTARKRAFKSLICLDVLADYLFSNGYKVDISKNLYKIPKINEEFEFTDLHYNGKFLNIVPVLNGKFILIPKAHFAYNVVPDMYIAADYSQTTKKVKFLGCIEKQNISKSRHNDKYFIMEVGQLDSPENIEPFLNTMKIADLTETSHDIFASFFIDYLDGVLDKEKTERLIMHLAECQDCRSAFVEYFDYESIVKNTKKFPDLFHDHTLDIVGATAVNDDKYKDFKEITLEIDKEPDEYAEDEENDISGNNIESAIEDPLQVLYGKGKNREIFDLLNNTKKQAAKSVLSGVMDDIEQEIKTHTMQKDVKGSLKQGVINPDYYTEDLSEGYDHFTPEKNTFKENSPKAEETVQAESPKEENILSEEQEEVKETAPVKEIHTNSDGKPLFLEDVVLSDIESTHNTPVSPSVIPDFQQTDKNFGYTNEKQTANTDFSDFDNDVLIIEDEDENIQPMSVSSQPAETEEADLLLFDDKDNSSDTYYQNQKQAPVQEEPEDNYDDLLNLSDKETDNTSSDENLFFIDNNEPESPAQTTQPQSAETDDDDFLFIDDNGETVAQTPTQKAQPQPAETDDDDFLFIDDNGETIAQTPTVQPQTAKSDDDILIYNNDEQSVDTDSEFDIGKTDKNDFVPESLVLSEEDLIGISDDSEENYFYPDEELININAEDIDLVDENDAEYFSDNISSKNQTQYKAYSVPPTPSVQPLPAAADDDLFIIDDNSEPVSQAQSRPQPVETDDDDFLFIDDNGETVEQTPSRPQPVETDDDDMLIIDDDGEPISQAPTKPQPVEADNDDMLFIDDDSEPIAQTPSKPLPVETDDDDDMLIIDDDGEPISQTPTKPQPVETDDDDMLILDDDDEPIAQTPSKPLPVETDDEDMLILDDEEEHHQKVYPVKGGDDKITFDLRDNSDTDSSELLKTDDDDVLFIDDEEPIAATQSEQIQPAEADEDTLIIDNDEEPIIEAQPEQIQPVTTDNDDTIIIDDGNDELIEEIPQKPLTAETDDDTLIIDDDELLIQEQTDNQADEIIFDSADDDILPLDDTEEMIITDTEGNEVTEVQPSPTEVNTTEDNNNIHTLDGIQSEESDDLLYYDGENLEEQDSISDNNYVENEISAQDDDNLVFEDDDDTLILDDNNSFVRPASITGTESSFAKPASLQELEKEENSQPVSENDVLDLVEDDNDDIMLLDDEDSNDDSASSNKMSFDDEDEVIVIDEEENEKEEETQPKSAPSQLDLILNSLSEKEKAQIENNKKKSEEQVQQPAPEPVKPVTDFAAQSITPAAETPEEKTEIKAEEPVLPPPPPTPPKRIFREFKDAISAKEEAIQEGRISNTVDNSKNEDIDEPAVNGGVDDEDDYEYVYVDEDDDEYEDGEVIEEKPKAEVQKAQTVKKSKKSDEDSEEYDEDEEYSDEDSEEYEEDEEEDEEEENPKNKNLVKIGIIAAAVLIVLAGAGFGAKALFFKNTNNTSLALENDAPVISPTDAENAGNTEEGGGLEIPNDNEAGEAQPAENAAPSATEEDGGLAIPDGETPQTPPPAAKPVQAKAGTSEATTEDMNKALTNAFSDNPSAVTVSKVSWGVNSALTTDSAVKIYIQNTGKLIKSTLLKNLTNVKVNPTQPVKIKIKYGEDGTMQDVVLSKSSGTNEIDEIVLQSVKQTVQNCKLPILSENTLQAYEQATGNKTVNLSLTVKF